MFKKYNLFIAILWTIVLVGDLICYFVGETPTWILVFCPMLCYTLDLWSRYYFNNDL